MAFGSKIFMGFRGLFRLKLNFDNIDNLALNEMSYKINKIDNDNIFL